ncbi:MAG TPA: DNA polymerase IV [Bacteroidales bacterium]|nr:DNA polymerase IV [Bacteroidales bacterium]
MRKIIHIDMDAFFASVEQRDFPEYRGKPLVVGSRSTRSVVAAASYEARKYGIHSAMPVSVALRKCKELIIAPHRFDVYRKVSGTIRDIFHEYTDLVEPLSLDEAYLDVTHPKKGPPSASLIAMEIKKEIRARENLVASAGVSYNKFLAKIASDMDKPDGFFLIKPEDAEHFLEELDIKRFFGVGERTEEKMHRLNIFHGRDLKAFEREQLIRHFGKVGNYFYEVVRGIDERPVVPFRESKSIGAERTYETDLFDMQQVEDRLTEVMDIMWKRCRDKKKFGKTLTLKVRFSDFSTITRSRTQREPYAFRQLMPVLKELLPTADIRKDGIRLLGVTLSNFPVAEKPVYRQIEIDFGPEDPS